MFVTSFLHKKNTTTQICFIKPIIEIKHIILQIKLNDKLKKTKENCNKTCI